MMKVRGHWQWQNLNLNAFLNSFYIIYLSST